MDQSIEWGDEDDDTDWSQMIDLELEIQKSPTQPRKKLRLENNTRKFPGPAGNLPQDLIDRAEHNQSFARRLAKIKVRHTTTGKQKEKNVVCHEELEDELGLTREELIDDNKAWKAIRKDEDFTEEYFKYDIGYIKEKVKSTKSSIKIPIFCSVIKSIDTSSGLDPSCDLMDSNGVILANIHREVIQNHGNQLKPGTALVLKNVGIFFSNEIPSVIITEKSLVSMFCNNPASYGINFHRISELKHEELIRLQAQVDKENKFAQSSSVNTQTQIRNAIIPLVSSLSSTSSIGPSASCNSFPRPNNNKSWHNTPRNSTPVPNLQMPQQISSPKTTPSGPRDSFGPIPNLQMPPPISLPRPAAAPSPIMPPPSSSTSQLNAKIDAWFDEELADIAADIDQDSLFGSQL